MYIISWFLFEKESRLSSWDMLPKLIPLKSENTYHSYQLHHFLRRHWYWHFLYPALNFKKIYLNWRIIALQYCDGFCHKSIWIGHRHVSPILTTLLPASLPHPSRLSQSTALSALLHASRSHWSSVLHMVIYMFQCFSLISSHLLLLPLSPKVCSLHLCLLCCPVCKIISMIFPDSIYMC